MATVVVCSMATLTPTTLVSPSIMSESSLLESNVSLRFVPRHSGRLSRKGTDNAELLAVVSRKAMVVGSKRGDAFSPNAPSDTVAYSGRVPVRVRGLVGRGDHIVPSGLEDGTGVSCFQASTRLENPCTYAVVNVVDIHVVQNNAF